MVMNKPSALTQQQQQQQKLAATATTATTTTIDINNMKLPPFLKKLQMILESVPAHVAGWDETGKVFEVLNVPLFAAELKKHFKGNEQTFIRQLHFYGFSKLDSTRNHRLANNSKLQLPEASPGAWSFSHPLLLRDSPDLFWNIQRQGEKKEPDGFEEIKSLRASVKTLESVVAQLSTKLSMVMNLLESKGIELETSTSPAVGQKRARKMDQVIDVKLSQPAKSADDLVSFKAAEAEPLVRSKAASSSFTMSDEDDDDDDFDTNDTFPYDSSIFELSTPPAAFEDGVFSITEEEVDSSTIDFMTDSMIQDDLKIESVTNMMTKQLSFDSALVEPIHLSRQSSWKNDNNNNNNNSNNNSNSSSSDDNKKKNTNKQGSSRFSLSSSSVAANTTATTTPNGTTDPASMAKVVLYLRAAIAAASSAPSNSTEASLTTVGPNSTPVHLKSAVSVSKENHASSNNNNDNSSNNNNNNNNSGSVSKLADSNTNNNNTSSSSNVGPQELLLPLLLSLPQIQSALSTIEASSAKSITSSSGASLLASSGWMKPTLEIPA